MLGAQALRTKQKVEQKEKEKRQRERQKNLELQRERIQKVAREDEAKFLQKMADMRLEDAQALIEMANEQKKHPGQQTRHHSLHPVSAMNSHMPSMSARTTHNSADLLQLPQRSPSTDLGKASDEGSSGSRFMKWLGLSQGRREPKKPRRMSTFS